MELQNNGKSMIYDHEKLEKSFGKWLRQRPTTGNSDVAAKTGNIYISRTTTDSLEIIATNPGFSTVTNSMQLIATGSGKNNSRQNSYVSISGCPSCRSCLGALSSSWPSKNTEMPLELSCYLSYFQRYKYFPF